MKQDENGFWTYQASFAEEMDGNVKVRGQKGLKNRTTDLIYLRSGDRNFAIGVITNKTYNIKTQSTCFPEEEWPKNYSTLNEAQTIDLSKSNLLLSGVISSRYIVDYYLPSVLSKPFYTLENHRVGIRFTRDYVDDGISMLNEVNMQNKYSMALGVHYMKQFGPDWNWETYQTRYNEVCDQYNLHPTDTVIFGLGDEVRHSEFNRGVPGNYRVCISEYLNN
jgi:hypothetical protein